MKSNIPSTRKLLKFIYRNPNCSADKISNFFRINKLDAVAALNSVEGCIVSKTVIIEESWIIDHYDIQLTPKGRQFIEDKSWDRRLIIVSLFISALSLLVSIFAAYAAYNENKIKTDTASDTSDIIKETITTIDSDGLTSL